MNCFHCGQKIDESKGYEITAPDGDAFHKKCLRKFKKERERFFNEIIHDDDKFYDWLGFNPD